MDYPDTREALLSLIDQKTFAGQTVTGYFQLTPEAFKSLPAVLIYPLGGTEGWVDREDRLGVDVYAIGTKSLEIAEQIRSMLVAKSHSTPAGYLDDVRTETVPVDVPYPDPTYDQTQAVYRVITRPLP